MVVSGVTVWTKSFSRSLKVASDCEVTTSSGRLFHRRGAAAPKARSPAVLIYCDVFAYCCSFIFFLNWVDVILFYFSISFFLLVIVTVKNVIINIVAIAILRRREHLWDGNAWRLMLRLREQVCRHCERHAALALNLFRRLASSAQWLQRIATLQITSNLCGWWCGDSSSTMTCHTRRLAKMSYTPAVRTHDTRSSRALPMLHSLAFKNNAMQLVVKTSMKINLYW